MEHLPTTIRLYGTAADSIVDGPGLRYSVFVQGCSHGCVGCHNPESQSRDGGYKIPIEKLLVDIEANKLITGVTISGGEPLEQSAACLALLRHLKEKPFNIWIYSGYRFEAILAGRPNLRAKELILSCDVLVDGPYVESLHSHDLLWKGSSNQRVIDIPKSIDAKEVILWESQDAFPQIPPSW